MSKTICFWDNQLCERGTTVALFDYAYYNQTLLNNKSIIMYNNTSYNNTQSVIDKFNLHFKVIGVNNFKEVDQLLLDNNVDIFYIIKSGENDMKVSKVCKTVVHCVFNCSQAHGQVYASIAPWVKYNDNKYPCVPHMINLPNVKENMRNMLNIPKESIVFGRYGGYDQFDIRYVHQIVYEVAKNNSNIYFLFANTRQFCQSLPNIIHLGQIVDLDEKVKFINTCDAMLWARSDGETFGLAIGEFSTKNKPVICTMSKRDNAHMRILKHQAIWYKEDTLKNILTNFDPTIESQKDWNAYREYSPENVMQIFKKVFID